MNIVAWRYHPPGADWWAGKKETPNAKLTGLQRAAHRSTDGQGN